MRNKLTSIFIFLSLHLFAQNKTENSFIDTVTKEYLTDIQEYILGDRKETLYLIEQDLNNDGKKDVMISGYYKGAWGNAGGEWDIYYQLDSGFRKCEGRIFMYPDAAKYDSIKNQVVLYHRHGCCKGTVAIIDISDCKINLVETKKYEEETGDLTAEKISYFFKGLANFDQKVGITNNKEVIEWK